MRYERIGSVIERWYTADAPVCIEAAVLLKDLQTDSVLAQLKWRNMSEKPITALTVSVQPLDADKAPLGEAITYVYEHTVAPEDTCGKNIPIVLAQNDTADMTVCAVRAVFEDGGEWEAAADAVWSTAPEEPAADDIPVPTLSAPADGEESTAPKRTLPKWVIPVSVAAAIAVLLGVCWKPLLYGVGRLLTVVEEYEASAAVLQTVADFADASERLAEAKTAQACRLLRVYDYDGAVAYLGEADADRLMKDTATATLFLTGEWYTADGAYYFTMDDEGGVRYNVPAASSADGVYGIENGYFQREDDSGVKVSLWKFHVVNGDTVEVHHRNGQIYTLVRYG